MKSKQKGMSYVDSMILMMIVAGLCWWAIIAGVEMAKGVMA